MSTPTGARVLAIPTALALSALLFAQFPPPRRKHTATEKGKLLLVEADKKLEAKPSVTIEVKGEHRVITANGIPKHHVGAFPNRGNPHDVKSQRYAVRVPAKPNAATSRTPLGLQNFGIAVNGVPFDPGAAEWYLGNDKSGWQYEALAGAVPLGLDANHAHVQPTGAYHYHGQPVALLDELGVKPGSHSKIVGWAADGFPIYSRYGYSHPEDPKSAVTALRSSYRLKKGSRPGGDGEPGGRYDGTFVEDYEYSKEAGDLDESNGRFCVTPEYPEGTYAYFLTDDWPVIPRSYRGTPSKDFERKPGRRGPPPRRPR